MPTSTSSTAPRSRTAASYDNAKVVNRFDLTKRLVAKLKKDEAVIGGIGNTNFDLRSAGRRPQNFYMLGSMGLAIPIALGVALAQPRRHVIALEGDGSLLMQLGCLTTIAALKPANHGQRPLPDHRWPTHRGSRKSPTRSRSPAPPASPRAPGPQTRMISTAWSMPRSPTAGQHSSPPASTTSRASAPPTATPCRSGSASCTGSECAGWCRGS
jgi:hypothetical protein